jgi:protein-tyrosine kinase
MSEFFRALERAERERARRSSEAAKPNGSAIDTAAPPVPDVASITETLAPPDPVPVMASVVTAPEVAVDAPFVEAPPAAERRPAGKPLSVAIGQATGTHPTGEVDERLVSLITPDTFEADQYRVLRHAVEQRRRTAGVAIVAVTSAGAGDGKTTTAANLAGALAQDRGARVLLIDCDLRNSTMARRLGLAEGRGLVQAIVDPALTLEDAIRHLPRYNVDVMPAGFETASPYELLKSPRLGELFEAARRRYDYVVVDTPPAVPFPDCRVLAKVVDGFILVVAAHHTPRRLVDETLEVLPKEALMGVVFNGDTQSLADGYHSYYTEDGGDTAGATTWRSSARKAWARVGRG